MSPSRTDSTNGALMALEIPGLYVRKDLQQAYMFDHLVLKGIEQKGKRLRLTVFNPTPFDATLTVLAEDAQQAATPLPDNAFVQWSRRITVKKGKSAVITI